MPKPTNNRLSAIRQFLIDSGTLDKDAILKAFKMKESDYEPTLRQLQAEYPNEFNFEFDDEEEERTPIKYKLQTDTKFLKDLEIVSEKDGLVVLQVSRPKDLVTIVVKGKTVEVDLIRLRELNPETVQHGVKVSRLIELAELAK